MSEDYDLNLLRVFVALVDTGSVSAAAGRLHLSVPATSRSLGRLRRAMDDPIMVRAGRGLVPTPFAQQSLMQIRSIVESAANLRLDPSSTPAQWERTFAIRINDGLAPVLSPRLITRIAKEAPGVTIRFVAQDSKDPEPLRDGDLDLDIGVVESLPPDVHVEPLFTDHFVALVSSDSDLGIASGITVDDLVRYPHISTSRRGRERGPLDDLLGQLGLARRVCAVVPSFAVSALLSLEPDIISLVPRVLAEHLVERGAPLRWHEVPLEMPPVDVTLRWHRRLEEDRPSQWLRNQVRIALKPLILRLG